jgi:hypothetical protein
MFPSHPIFGICSDYLIIFLNFHDLKLKNIEFNKSGVGYIKKLSKD